MGFWKPEQHQHQMNLFALSWWTINIFKTYLFTRSDLMTDSPTTFLLAANQGGSHYISFFFYRLVIMDRFSFIGPNMTHFLNLVSSCCGENQNIFVCVLLAQGRLVKRGWYWPHAATSCIVSAISSALFFSVLFFCALSSVLAYTCICGCGNR